MPPERDRFCFRIHVRHKFATCSGSRSLPHKFELGGVPVVPAQTLLFLLRAAMPVESFNFAAVSLSVLTDEIPLVY